MYSISIFLYIISNYLVDSDGQCEKRKECVCFELAKVTGEKENGVFYIQVVNKWQDLCFQDHPLDLIF